MRFIGYVPRPGGLGYMGKEAMRAAKATAPGAVHDGRAAASPRGRWPRQKLFVSGTATVLSQDVGGG